MTNLFDRPPNRGKAKYAIESEIQMRIAWLVALVAILSGPAAAWERLVTVTGSEIEGDVSQPEFVLIDKAGGEVAIPRAAILRFEAGSDGLKAFIKDGTVVEGILQGKFEIGDGLIKRRYAAEEIRTVEFDRYIAVAPGKKYHSCPIRVQLNVGQLVFDDGKVPGANALSSVLCNEMSMRLLSISMNGRIKKNKRSKITTEIKISIPEGEDQRLDLRLTLMQGEKVLNSSSKVLPGDEAETVRTFLSVDFDGATLDPSGPEPRLLVQLVSQEDEKQVEKGSYFWWFTFPIPVG